MGNGFQKVPQDDPDKGKDGPAEPEEISKPICYAELSTFMLSALGFLLTIAGLGFFTVHPPGEEDLCTVQVLGLENKTKTEQASNIASCHMLYTVVFDSLHVISLPFVICGFVALLTGYIVCRGAHAKAEDITPSWFRCAMLFDLVGLLLSGATSIPFAAIWGTVSVALAPIHAYFITIMIGHLAVTAVNYTSGEESNATADDDNVRTAAQVYNTLYMGYCACSRVELCLTVGTMCLWLVGGIYVFDLLRNLCAVYGCFKPHYGERMRQGSHLRIWWHNRRKAADVARQEPLEPLAPSA